MNLINNNNNNNDYKNDYYYYCYWVHRFIMCGFDLENVRLCEKCFFEFFSLEFLNLKIKNNK